MSVRKWPVAACELLRALAVLAVIEASLRTGDLPSTCRRLRVALDLTSPAPPTAARPPLPRWARPAVRVCLAVAAWWPAGDTCLRRCLLLGHRLHALEPVLRIGVKRNAAGHFAAHSWLEIDGQTLDPTAFEFAALSSRGNRGSG